MFEPITPLMTIVELWHYRHDNASQQERAAEKTRLEWKKTFENVTNKQETWTTYTPSSQQHLYAELHLMVTLNASNKWHMHMSAWHSQLMPEGHLVRHKDKPADVFFVYRAYSVACVMWPAKQLTPNIWEEDRNIKELTWMCVFDIEEWEELPSVYASPIHLYLEDLWAPFPRFETHIPETSVLT
jgi:hypothetical protein